MRTETPKKVKKFRNGLRLEKFGTPPHTETTRLLYIQKINKLPTRILWVGVGFTFPPTFSFTLLYYTIIIRYFIIYPIQLF